MLVALLAVATTILALAALHLAQPIAAPLAFALFTIAVVWSLHGRLGVRLPKLLALALTLLAAVLVVGALGSLVAWGVRGIGQWLVANAPRLQGLYQGLAAWFEQHGIYLAGILAEQLDTATILRVVRQVTGWLQGSLSFALLILVLVMIGLVEVEVVAGKLARHAAGASGFSVAAMTAERAAKSQRVMLVRTGMSIVTGLAVWAFAALAGLGLAGIWAMIAFALDHSPFLGPLVATLFPTLLAIARFDTLAGVLPVFLGLQAIPSLSGSCIEPRAPGESCRCRSWWCCCRSFSGTSYGAWRAPSSACRSSSRCRRSAPASRRCAVSPSCSTARRRLTSAATPIARPRCHRAPAAASRTVPAPRRGCERTPRTHATAPGSGRGR